MVDLLFRLRLVWIALLAGAVVGAGVGLAMLRFDFTPQNLFQSGDPAFAQLERVQRLLGRQDGTAVIVVTAPDVTAPPVVDLLVRLKTELEAVDGVLDARGLPDARFVPRGSPLPIPAVEALEGDALRETLLAQPLVRGRILSADARATIMLVRIDPERMKFERLEEVVRGVLDVIEKIARPGDVAIEATGVPIVRVVLVHRMQADMATFTPLCGLLFLGILFWLFRDARAVLIPLGAVGVSTFLTMGALGLGGEPINVINNVYPTLIFVIGISDAIHLVSRYREELAAGHDRERALRRTVTHLAVACFLTSFTTAVGFASLAVAQMDILKRFGLWAAAGLMIAYAVTVVIVPLAFSFAAPILPADSLAVDRRARRLALGLIQWVLRRPKTILAGGVIVIVGAGLLGSRVQVTNNLYETFSTDDPIVAANREVERHFTGVVPFAVFFEWDEGVDPLRPEVLAYLDELGARIDGLPLAGSSISIADVAAEWNVSAHLGDPAGRTIPATPALCRLAVTQTSAALAAGGADDVVASVWNEPARIMRVQAWTGDHGSRAIKDGVFDRIEGWLEADRARIEALGLRAFLNGDGYVASQGINRLIDDMFTSLLLAFIVIFVTMVLLLRSIRAALVSMIPNVAPLVVTLGFMGLVGMDLRLTSVIVFTISLGLAVDDTIHCMARFREEWFRRPSYESALRRAYRGTGKAVVTTTVVLAVGFGVLLFSRFPVSRTFALCMEVTVIGALVADLVLLPACLVVLRPIRLKTPPEARAEGAPS